MRQKNVEGGSTSDCDSELYRKFLTGDITAQREFVRRWQSPMFRIAIRIVGQPADAEEVRQAVLLRMIERPDVLPDPDRIASWIRRCVVNESISLLRKRKRQVPVEQLDDSIMSVDSVHLDDTEFLGEMLARLEPGTRALLALRFDENLTVRQIAEVVQEPRSTVHAKIQSAIDSLRSRFKSI